MLFLFTIFLSFLLKFNLIICDNSDEIIVTTKLGEIKGNSVEVLNKTIFQYLSIPYAEPPIGELRFGKPLPIKPWNNTLNATELKNSCMQNSRPGRFLVYDEDCLFLNIW